MTYTLFIKNKIIFAHL